jgi:ferredoxin--NADP+ reductase
MPVRIEGDGKVERVIVERTQLDPNGRASGTGETCAIPCGLVVSCIGYRTPPIEGVPYETELGRFANHEGRIVPGLYCVGWARRGPSGTIGTNRPDGFAVADLIAADYGTSMSRKAGHDGLERVLKERGIDIVTFRDWQKIEAAEAARARDGSPREKFTDVAEMLAQLG